MKARRGDSARRRREDEGAGRSSDQPPSRLAARPAGVNDRAPYRGLLSPTDKVVIAYIIIISALILAFSYRIDLWRQLIAAHAMGVASVVLAAKWERRAGEKHYGRVGERAAGLSDRPSPSIRAARFVRGWYPVALIPITFTELRYLIPLIHPRDYDLELAAIDYRMFGVHPTVWLERLTRPLLTEALQISYVTYYFLPITLGAVLWRKGWADKYHFWVFVVAFGFYISYLGYMAVPAIGPRFLPLIKDAQTFPLKGVWLFDALRSTLDEAEGVTRDCFPSGHTEITLLVLYYARKFHRRTFWWLLPPATMLIFSTVYLRYHYVIDIAAGAVVALAVALAAKPIHRALGGELR
ncbi:MAG TPA: phosphatase PAP2 family protein [Blastocatellia bacterium]|jgi:membrane-associated phospholipid phosphatase